MKPQFPTGTDEQGTWTMVWQPWLDELLEAVEAFLDPARPWDPEARAAMLARLETAVRTLRGET